MRRVPGLILLGLGSFFVVGALMMRFFVLPNLLVTPMDQFAQSRAPGTGTVFSPSTLSEKQGVPLVAKRTIRGDVAASNRTVGVWDESLILSDATGKMINTTTDRVFFDRKTGMAVDRPGAAVNGKPVKHEGLSYKFPFHAKKTSYQFFDTTARKAYPMRYQATEKLQGLSVYRYEQVVPAQQVGELTVPGELIGDPASPSVKAPQYYSNTRTVWVEPFSGVIVKGAEKQLQTLRSTDGTDRTKLLDATLIFDEKTQKQQADLARDARSKGSLVGVVLPLVLGLLGLALLVVGALMVLRDPAPRRDLA